MSWPLGRNRARYEDGDGHETGLRVKRAWCVYKPLVTSTELGGKHGVGRGDGVGRMRGVGSDEDGDGCGDGVGYEDGIGREDGVRFEDGVGC